MRPVLLRSLIAFLLPMVVFLAGAGVMIGASGHLQVSRQLNLLPGQMDREPLNQRLSGYDLETVRRQWSIFTPEASGELRAKELRRSEKLILQFDLVFPLIYGASFLFSYGLIWTRVGRTRAARWMILPVAVTVVADWTENVTHLHQLQRHAAGGAEALQREWMQVASLATTLKLTCFAVSGLAGLMLIGWFIFKSARALRSGR